MRGAETGRQQSPVLGWSVDWWPGAVAVRFADGAATLLDYGHMPPAQAREYAGYVVVCGYGRDVAMYARHHDLVHLWLAEKLWGIESPTLRAVADKDPMPPINALEEYLVNTVQWVLATGRRDVHADFLGQVMGPAWEALLDELTEFLNAPMVLARSMAVDELLQQDTLPLETLRELEAAGIITSAQSWAMWLDPEVHWIAPAEYGDAFVQIVSEGA